MSDKEQQIDWLSVGMKVFFYGISAYLTYSLLDTLTELIEMDHSKSESNKGMQCLKKLSFGGRQVKDLNKFELVVAQDVIDPNDIDITLDMIGGLEHEKFELLNTISMPIRHPEYFRGRKLLSFPKGMLLYGPPGTGKTMLAKAIAKESGAMFINLQLSTVFNMYLGESEKLIRAVFTLAMKLAPCVLFIDEIDSFLKQRNNSDQQIYGNIKAEFLQLWDGMLSTSDNGVIVIGASNRPGDIDEAFLRRLPRLFRIDLPDKQCRKKIFTLMLQDENTQNIDLDILSERTDGYSGSDIKEVCQIAAWEPLWEAQKFEQVNHKSMSTLDIRPITMNDFEKGLYRVKPTGEMAREYNQRRFNDDDPIQALRQLFGFRSEDSK